MSLVTHLIFLSEPAAIPTASRCSDGGTFVSFVQTLRYVGEYVVLPIRTLSHQLLQPPEIIKDGLSQSIHYFQTKTMTYKTDEAGNTRITGTFA